ncbi:MAG: hypothetical protein HQ553_17340 [Chloroflexi bacterium]|nr:hypothetical protein [Chloroflexota bacterium]
MKFRTYRPYMIFPILLLAFMVFVSGVAVAEEEAIYRSAIGTQSGNAPNVAMHNGSLNYQVPIEVPPGRNGIAPDLALAYNSAAGNGIVGVGWSLEVGSIQRSTKFGVRYDRDDFTFGGSAELVLRPEWEADYFGAKIEGSFAKYFYDRDNETWVATTTDGTEYYYGGSPASRQQSSRGIFKWCLDKVKDTNGNYMEVHYTKTPNGAPDDGQIYLDRIEYTGNENGLSPTNEVRFSYEGRLYDAATLYTTGAPVKTTHRLSSIEVYATDQNNNDLPVRKYVLGYDLRALTFRSLLQSIKQYGSDFTTELREISFDWDNNSFEAWNLFDTLNEPIFQNKDGSEYTDTKEYPLVICDFDGNGTTDIGRLTNDGIPIYECGLNGGWSLLHTIPASVLRAFPYPLDDSSEFPIVTGDFDGDGGAEVGQVRETEVEFYGLGDLPAFGKLDYENLYENPLVIGDFNGDGQVDLGRVGGSSVEFYTYDVADPLYSSDDRWVSMPSINDFGDTDGDNSEYANANRSPLLVGDFDGDGKTEVGRVKTWDLMHSASFYELADDNENWVKMTDFTIDDFLYSEYGRVYNSAFPVVIGDFNGDGISDISRAASHGSPYELEVAVLLSDGAGGWHKMGQHFVNTQWPNPYTNQAPIIAGDFNGDGMTDVGRYYHFTDGTNLVDFRTSVNGIGWYESSYVPGDVINDESYWFITNSKYPFFSGDFNGDGMTDAARIVDSGVDVMSLAYIGYPGGYERDLIMSISDSLNNTTMSMEYKPYKKEITDLDPYSSPIKYNNIPFTMQTVDYIKINDGLEHPYKTTYSYEDAMFDYETREFWGFGTVEQANPDGSTVTTTFYQDEYRAGLEKKVVVNGTTSLPYESLKSETTYTRDTLDIGNSESKFVRLTQKIMKYYGGGSAVETRDDYIYYPDHGGVNTIKSWCFSGAAGETVTTDQDYGYFGSGVSNYPLRMTSEILRDSNNAITRKTTYDYEQVTGNHLSTDFVYNVSTGASAHTSYDYDQYGYGNLTEVTDANGNPPTVTVYDTLTQTFPVKETNAAGHVVEYPEADFDYRFGKPGKEIDQNGNETSYTYDVFGRIKEVNYPDGGQVVTTYFDNEMPRKVRTAVKENASADYINSWVYFDGLGREVQSVSFGEGQKPIVTKNYYDSMGRNYRTEGPFFGALSYSSAPSSANYPRSITSYDERGRPETVTIPANPLYVSTGASSFVTTFEYESDSTTVTDPDGGMKKETKDYLGRLIEVIEDPDEGGLNLQTKYEYNAAGDLLKVTDALNNETVIRYDSLGQKKYMNDPDMGEWDYTYDDNGNLETQTDAKGQTITFTYDELNRVKTKSYSTNDPPVTYVYDLGTKGKGLLYSVSNAFATTTYDAYDAMGRVKSVTKTIDSRNYSTSTEYDLSGKVTEITHDTGPVTQYAYFANSGLLQNVRTGDNSISATFSGYQPAGSIGSIAYSNGISTDYSYDPKSTRLTNIESGNGSSNFLHDKEYTYSPAGDITSIEDAYTGITYSYEYDELHRLLSEEANGAATPTQASELAYTYDSGPLHAVDAIAGGGTFNAHYYDYDANGNMYDVTDGPSNPAKAITYNADNMPVRIENSETGSTVISEFAYDGSGSRAKKVVTDDPSTKTTHYVSSGYEYDVTNNEATIYVFAGNMRIAVVKNGVPYYLHKDHLGSTTKTTSASSQTVAEEAEFMPFGLMRNDPAPGDAISAYKFTDQELDGESGFYNYDARLYDPMIGLFITADTIVPDFSDPQSLNRYSYVRNNPLGYTDPSGHGFFSFAFAVLKAAFIGASVNGGFAVLTGGDVGAAMEAGAITGAFIGAAGQLPGMAVAKNGTYVGQLSKMQRTAVFTSAGGMAGAINADRAGGNWRNGAISGAMFAGINAHYGKEWMGSKGFSRAVLSGVAGGITADLNGGQFRDGFYTSFGMQFVKWAHYNRNYFNDNPQTYAEFQMLNKKGTYTTEPGDRSKFHMYGPGGEWNIKITYGLFRMKEAVYNGVTDQLQTNINAGTFNIGGCGGVLDVTHTIFDIAPYYFLGNTPYETSPFQAQVARVFTFIK